MSTLTALQIRALGAVTETGLQNVKRGKLPHRSALQEHGWDGLGLNACVCCFKRKKLQKSAPCALRLGIGFAFFLGTQAKAPVIIWPIVCLMLL
jgi:hypothetical protein